MRMIFEEYKKDDSRSSDIITIRGTIEMVIFILCHFLDNLIDSIIKFYASQLNRRLEIEGTDNACLTTGKLQFAESG